MADEPQSLDLGLQPFQVRPATQDIGGDLLMSSIRQGNDLYNLYEMSRREPFEVDL